MGTTARRRAEAVSRRREAARGRALTGTRYVERPDEGKGRGAGTGATLSVRTRRQPSSARVSASCEGDWSPPVSLRWTEQRPLRAIPSPAAGTPLGGAASRRRSGGRARAAGRQHDPHDVGASGHGAPSSGHGAPYRSDHTRGGDGSPPGDADRGADVRAASYLAATEDEDWKAACSVNDARTPGSSMRSEVGSSSMSTLAK